ncbi:MAG: pilus assembly protein PilM [Lachnospiraceae bacterium]|nr:pilus assembly protein PilM [Lachnospiraceae bacterium]
MAKILSIELGHSVIKLCEMDYKVNNPKIYQCQEAITPPGSVNDGYIAEGKMKDLAYAVKETIARNGIKTKKVVFTVASAKIINREVTVPDVKENQIGSVIQANLNDYFPVSLADYEVTYSLVQTIPDGPDQGKHRVNIFAAEKGMLEGYMKLAAACDLTVVNICCSGATIIETARRQANPGVQAIIKMEEKYSIISVMKNGVLMLQRSINYGVGDAMSTVASQPTFAAGDTLGVWRLITRQNCTSEQVPNVKEAGRPEARQAVTESLTPLIGGILRVFDYYASHFSGDDIENVSIVGLGAQFIGVPEILGSALGIVCRKAGMFQNIEAVDADVKQKSDAYSSCISAGFAADGFVHEDSKAKLTKDINYPLVSVLVGIMCAIVAITLAVISILPYRAQVAREKDLQQKYTEYEQGKVWYDQFVATTNVCQEIINGYALSQHANDNLLVFLGELEEKLPYDVVFQEFVSDDTMCTMTMQVPDKETAAKVVDTMREFDSIQYVYVEEVTEEKVEKNEDDKGNERGEDESEELVMIETKTELTVFCVYKPVLPEVSVPSAGDTSDAAAEPAAETTNN